MKVLKSTLVAAFLLSSVAMADRFKCKSAECTGQIITQNGTVVEISLTKNQVVHRGEGQTFIELTGTWS